jgi:hypothetical protein
MLNTIMMLIMEFVKINLIMVLKKDNDADTDRTVISLY